jgi:phosphohistidine phosphatase SixA
MHKNYRLNLLNRPLRLLLLLFSAWLYSSSAVAGEIWELLKQPGHIVLLRHSNAPGAKEEPYGINLKDCSIQRNLDEAGRLQARRIGDEFRKHGIQKLRLVSSQFCRALETAKLMNLGPVEELPALNQVFLADLIRLNESSEKTKKFMRAIPAKQLTVLVSHVNNIQSIAGTLLSSGEMVVVHFDPSGHLAVYGRILVP